VGQEFECGGKSWGLDLSVIPTKREAWNPSRYDTRRLREGKIFRLHLPGDVEGPCLVLTEQPKRIHLDNIVREVVVLGVDPVGQCGRGSVVPRTIETQTLLGGRPNPMSPDVPNHSTMRNPLGIRHENHPAAPSPGFVPKDKPRGNVGSIPLQDPRVCGENCQVIRKPDRIGRKNRGSIGGLIYGSEEADALFEEQKRGLFHELEVGPIDEAIYSLDCIRRLCGSPVRLRKEFSPDVF